MALPRSSYVNDDEIGVFHCFNRCVRRAFLCGVDPVSGRDYSHRKSWIVDRLRFLTTIFAIEVCAYAILQNHYHSILRTRPDIVALWSDYEVASRWLTLFPKYYRNNNLADAPPEQQIAALAQDSARIAILRKRLCSVSWFMGRLNEFIARAANKEDNVKGRFWESRFKCRPLLDSAATTACMVYVDLNLIRAGLASTPEQSDYTSIQQRIRSRLPDILAMDSSPLPNSHTPDRESDTSPKTLPVCPTDCSASWLCPIQSNGSRQGILQMTETEYINLVDKSGRILQSGKRGAIDANLAPILLRLHIRPEEWINTVSRFDSRFHLAAGLLSSLRSFADRLGKKWLKGFSAARIAFADSPL